MVQVLGFWVLGWLWCFRCCGAILMIGVAGWIVVEVWFWLLEMPRAWVCGRLPVVVRFWCLRLVLVYCSLGVGLSSVLVVLVLGV